MACLTPKDFTRPAEKQCMPPTPKYTVYAAPRCSDGRYRADDERPLFLREFHSLMAMRKLWDQKILPGTSTEFGLAYEFSMAEATDGSWDFIGDPRYADKPILPSRNKAR